MSETTSESVCADECGATCCHGHVFLGRNDETRLAEAGHSDFRTTVDGVPAVRTDDRNRCTFLGDDDRCTVYEHRPLDCRLFPFGFAINDRAETVEIVAVECPLLDHLPAETIESATETVLAAIERTPVHELRAYDSLPFEDDSRTIETLPMEVLAR